MTVLLIILGLIIAGFVSAVFLLAALAWFWRRFINNLRNDGFYD